MDRKKEKVYENIFKKLDKDERDEFKEKTSIEISKLSPGDPYVFLTPFEFQDLQATSGRLRYIQFYYRELPIPYSDFHSFYNLFDCLREVKSEPLIYIGMTQHVICKDKSHSYCYDFIQENHFKRKKFISDTFNVELATFMSSSDVFVTYFVPSTRKIRSFMPAVKSKNIERVKELIRKSEIMKLNRRK
jgi:hypothetical protein